MRSSVTSSAALSFDSGMTASAPSGQPVLSMISASISDEIGVCGAGFRMIGQPAAMAGATLWATRFSGKLNGVMREHRAEREAAHQAPAPGGGLQRVERNVLAVDARALFGGDLEGVDGAVHLDARGLDGLGGFLADGAGKLLAPRRNAVGNLAQNAGALVRRHLARNRERLHGGLDRDLHIVTVRLVDDGHHAAVIRRSHHYVAAVRDPVAVKEEPKAARWNRCGVSHRSPLSTSSMPLAMITQSSPGFNSGSRGKLS